MAFSSRGRIHRVRALVNVNKHRLGAAVGNRLGGCHECVGHGDHFIPRTDPRRQKRQPERIRAIPDAYGMIAAAVGGEILFELRDERTAGECRAVDNLLDRGIDLPAKRRVVSDEVKKRNSHWQIRLQKLSRRARDFRLQRHLAEHPWLPHSPRQQWRFLRR